MRYIIGFPLFWGYLLYYDRYCKNHTSDGFPKKYAVEGDGDYKKLSYNEECEKIWDEVIIAILAGIVGFFGLVLFI